MFAEMPLDNRTVDNSQAWPPSLAYSGRSGVTTNETI
jgi:hypothetical protein